MEEEETLADALVGGIGLNNRYTFRMVQEYVDETLLVTEEEIAVAMAFALQEHHMVVEGGAAVALAAVLHGRVEEATGSTVIVISGGNVEISLLLKIAQRSSVSESQ
jgi:threonine dehydratase